MPKKIILAPADYDAVVALMDNPPEPNDALRKLLTDPAPWDDVDLDAPIEGDVAI